MTDRYALNNGAFPAPCNTAAQKYCGGSWQGIIENLDYIQNMGFTAVCHQRLAKPVLYLHPFRCGFRLSYKI